MPTLDSTSSLDDVVDELMNTASWREQRSVALAKRFVTAATIWLLTNPQNSSHGRSSVAFDQNQIADLKRQAEQFISQNDRAGGGVKHLSLRRVRS